MAPAEGGTEAGGEGAGAGPEAKPGHEAPSKAKQTERDDQREGERDRDGQRQTARVGHQQPPKGSSGGGTHDSGWGKLISHDAEVRLHLLAGAILSFLSFEAVHFNHPSSSSSGALHAYLRPLS
jgi:hypothetical protein